VLEVLVADAAADRLITGTPDVHGLPVLVVSAVAAVVMVVAAVVLGGDDDDGDLSVKAVLLDTIADAAAAAGVAVVGMVIVVTGGWFWLDPAVALMIAVVVGYHALRLVARVVRQLRSRDRDRSHEPDRASAVSGAASVAPGRDRCPT